jgi:hypothetical protein
LKGVIKSIAKRDATDDEVAREIAEKIGTATPIVVRCEEEWCGVGELVFVFAIVERGEEKSVLVECDECGGMMIGEAIVYDLDIGEEE